MVDTWANLYQVYLFLAWMFPPEPEHRVYVGIYHVLTLLAGTGWAWFELRTWRRHR
jgi:hypothetical protein